MAAQKWKDSLIATCRADYSRIALRTYALVYIKPLGRRIAVTEKAPISPRYVSKSDLLQNHTFLKKRK